VPREEKLQKRSLFVFVLLAVLLTLSVFLYIYSRTYAKAHRLNLEMDRAAFDSIMARTVPALIGMAVAAVLTAVVSLSFQTVTGSRILTPSMFGFDSVYVGTQTILVFMFGSVSRAFVDPYINYVITAGTIIAVSMMMYGFILRKNKNNLVFLLMFGLILSGIVRSGSAYLQVIMDAGDYNRVKAATSVTVNNMNTRIIFMALPLMLAVIVAMLIRHKTYDVMALGENSAKSLGIHYEKEIRLNLFLISLGMSVTTALIGSLTFLGLLAVNIARELFRTHRHIYLFIGSAGLSALALIAGQALSELLQGAVPVTVIIDLVGCSYMFYLILKEGRVK